MSNDDDQLHATICFIKQRLNKWNCMALIMLLNKTLMDVLVWFGGYRSPCMVIKEWDFYMRMNDDLC